MTAYDHPRPTLRGFDLLSGSELVVNFGYRQSEPTATLRVGNNPLPLARISQTFLLLVADHWQHLAWAKGTHKATDPAGRLSVLVGEWNGTEAALLTRAAANGPDALLAIIPRAVWEAAVDGWTVQCPHCKTAS